ncbi:hypothetical protein EVAR_62232_1 [Eumeta japonica]|uniref:Uncharacterized protein n=1 Tax=Eumeta variegata TaxID=151549 RepID=A0A4C1Z6J4_EUMVA|nr:hypothetical protein EVAR_62232_1 [Eumeta japonica]
MFGLVNILVEYTLTMIGFQGLITELEVWKLHRQTLKVNRDQNPFQGHSNKPKYGCGWESLMKSVTLGNVTMSHRTREPAECLASLSHSTMIGLPRAQH